MIYLDNAATTPLKPEVKEYVISLLNCYGNPSSIYEIGQQSRRIIETARENVRRFIGSPSPDESDILFTSGGSASNTLGIAGYYRRHYCTVFYSPTMHKSVLKCVAAFGDSHPLEVDAQGFINVEQLKWCVGATPKNKLVVIEYANSEIGTVQDIKKIVSLVHSYGGIVYLDCTASVSSIPLDVKELDIDMAGFSGHKIGAFKGVGVLYKKKWIELDPLIYGAQEQGLFGGTENLIGIASLGKAVEVHDYSSILSRSRDYVWNYINNEIDGTYLIGASISSGKRIPHNLYVVFSGIEGEELLILLDIAGIQVSTGSACNSANLQPSSTLTAIGTNPDDYNSTIRMSFSGDETVEELDYVCSTLKRCVKQLRGI